MQFYTKSASHLMVEQRYKHIQGIQNKMVSSKALKKCININRKLNYETEYCTCILIVIIDGFLKLIYLCLFLNVKQYFVLMKYTTLI